MKKLRITLAFIAIASLLTGIAVYNMSDEMEDDVLSDYGELDRETKKAYRDVIKTAKQEEENWEELRYSFIYFNDDDIPDLIIDYPGTDIHLYVYENGEMYCPMNGWGWYGSHNDKVRYEYIEEESTIREVDSRTGYTDFYLYFYALEDYRMEYFYELDDNHYDDIDRDELPDPEEVTPEALANARGWRVYSCFTDDNLTQDEIRQRMEAIDAKGWKPIIGELTYKEILKLL